jgi:two-component system OmpR family response regulator
MARDSGIIMSKGGSEPPGDRQRRPGKKEIAVRVLIVEDEAKIASFLKRGLREEGYSVDVAEDGERGFFLATTETYDLVVLDLMLPRLDGLSLCRKLREADAAVPVLMLTAKDSVQDKVAGLDSGADDYLTKPFAFEEFLARCRALLRKKESRGTTKLRVDDLEMDLVSHRVTRGEEEIPLTPREFALLEFLMRHEGAVVTRTMISEHVWDMNFDSFSNVIDVYINYLRKKIDQNRPRPLIRTLRGRGYTLKG